MRESLAKRLRHGDHQAAVELVDLYYDRLYLFMRALGHGRDVSEDLTQETFLRAWYHIDQLRNGRALNGWLFRIAGNVSNLHWRRRRGKEHVSIDDMDPGVPGISQADEAGHREQVRRLRQAVARLPWKLRQAIVLHYMEHLTIAEAAEAANVRQGTFKSRLNRALTALREAIG